jgi:hypothetical protein
MHAMRQAEESLGADTPIIIFTDAEVFDTNLKPSSYSYWL